MSDYGDNIKYKWTPESTSLLVSVWTDKQVQKQLDYAQRPQLIWESVARYMTKKGYGVSAKQCRSRMKQVLVCYREAKRAGTQAGVEQYYESIDKVLKNKKMEHSDDGIDTVDSALIVKSPPKDVKTNKNLRMRYNRYSEPAESLIRTEALSPNWHLAHEEEYPDSPESNETVLAQPYRTFSPTRDAATNTLNGPSQLLAKSVRRSLPVQEQPIRESRVIEQPLPNNRFGEMLYQNTVQNVQNQIIQENMQQQRNLVQNQIVQEEIVQPEQMYRRQTKQNPIFYPIDGTMPSKYRVSSLQNRPVIISNDQPVSDNMIRMQNQLQQACMTDNRAMPQEPVRENFRQNYAMNYKLYKEAPEMDGYRDQNLTRIRPRTNRNYSPETAANLNEAFCQDSKAERNRHNLNDSYEQQLMENDVIRAMNATTITNNATFNDDTLSIEFLEGSPSPSPSDNGAVGAKSVSGNSDKIPDAPVRKKKVQKLEQLMLSAITSQNEVVNKILAAQDAMVSRFLDLDRDRQNRLENRLDHLMNVVHATVINKSPDKDSDPGAILSNIPESTVITNLEPPPRPGVIPPKLDLVPPKPCRVPCTTANANVELINQKTIETRPGVVSPIKPGAIWSKLGPVSQSPFVKAQQQLGLRSTVQGDARTQSSAERRIAREMASRPMDSRTLKFECERLLEEERLMEEQAENAKILAKMGQEVATRRKLFAGRSEFNAGIILTAAFLDEERSSAQADIAPKFHHPLRRDLPSEKPRRIEDDENDDELMLLAGQVEKYERLRRLKLQSQMPDEPCDTSTPAKSTNPAKPSAPICNNAGNFSEAEQVPRQTIQQLAELVMKSARWRDAALNEKINNRFVPSVNNGSVIPSRGNDNLNAESESSNDELVKQACELRDKRRSYAGMVAERESNNKALGWLQERYSYDDGDQIRSNSANIPNRQENPIYAGPILPAVPVGQYPIGFTTANFPENRRQIEKQERGAVNHGIGFNPDVLVSNNCERRNVAFADLEGPQALMERIGQATYPRQRRNAPEPPRQPYNRNNCGQHSTLPAGQQNMIDRYTQENGGIVARKQQANNSDDNDDDDEFLDTTMSMQPSRKTSLTSNGTLSGKQARTASLSNERVNSAPAAKCTGTASTTVQCQQLRPVFNTISVTKNTIDRFAQENRGIVTRKQQGNNSSDNVDDAEFLETTTGIESSQKTSLTSSGTLFGKQANFT